MPLVDPGQKAPPFRLKDQSGRAVSLSRFRGRPVVVYFYPEDDTPLCTAQACQFRDHHPGFAAIGAEVVGISPQRPMSHAAFARAYGLPFTLLADEPDVAGIPAVSFRYGAWGEKNMYGRLVVGMIRTTYLIDAAGRIARRWDRVKTPGHAQAVLEAARRLAAGEPVNGRRTTRDEAAKPGIGVARRNSIRTKKTKEPPRPTTARPARRQAKKATRLSPGSRLGS